jgi:hypothetical protein
MAKVVVAKLNPVSRVDREKTSVTEKRVRDKDGRVKTLHVIDAGSRTFGTDLQYVFAKNVAKARRDNKRLIGSSDVVVDKN